MTDQKELRMKRLEVQEVLPNPPPARGGEPGEPMFQGMDELRQRHGEAQAGKDRLYLWGGGLLIGSLLFGMLCLMILFLE
jgi:hypothetical protein